MCGLFGGNGKTGKNLNLHKLIILGLFNEQRGRDSTGFYHSGNIQKGIGLESDFSDFIANHNLTPGPLKGKVFLGHTRKSTAGLHNEENAHPHVIGDNYVQTHNGVIRNIWTLCSKYKIPWAKIAIDSIGLAELISAYGPKPILEEYTGAAALAFTWMKKPESLFLYHGKSKETKDGEPISERPLYVLYQPEGLYYSSMVDSLRAISSTDDKPLRLKHNAVFEIIEGEFVNKLVIDRLEANVMPAAYKYVAPAGFLPPAVTKPPIEIKQPELPNMKNGKANNNQTNHNDLITKEPELNLSVDDINTVVYYKGRYSEVIRSIGKVGGVTTRPLHGQIVIKRDCTILDKPEPDPLDGQEHKYFFIYGIMIKSKEAYQELLRNGMRGHTEEQFKQLSEYAQYPIIQIKGMVGVGQTLWFHKGAIVKKYSFTPKFSDRSYTIKYGATAEIK